MDSEMIKVSDEDGLSQDNKDCFVCLDSMTVYKEGKYEVSVLWQEEKRSFPNNYSVALKEVQYAKATSEERSRLEKDTTDTYIEKGYAKKLSREEACKVSEKTWYLPHHPVFNKNKPEKF